MENYVVRINAKTVEDLRYLDFSNVSNDVIRIKSNKSININTGKFGLMYDGLSFETFINGFHSIGMMLLSKHIISKSNRRISLKDSFDKSIISGTVDIFNSQFIIDEGDEDSINICENDDILMIRFVTKEFHDHLVKKETRGIRSSNIDIQIYINGEFKPYSEKQMESHGYELIKSTNTSGCKFYDRIYIKYEDNWIKPDGSTRSKPLYDTCSWIDCEL